MSTCCHDNACAQHHLRWNCQGQAVCTRVFYTTRGELNLWGGEDGWQAPWRAPWSRSRDEKAYIHMSALSPHTSWTSCLPITLPNMGLKQMKQRESKRELSGFKGRVVILPSRSFLSREWQWLKQQLLLSLPEWAGAGSTHVHVRKKESSLSIVARGWGNHLLALRRLVRAKIPLFHADCSED